MFSFFKNKKGFTLIELLVVVAIIGILSSIVLASLNSARGKGTEAGIKSNLRNMIAQAELSYDTSGDYSGACAGVAKMMSAITNAGGTPACWTYDNSRWGVSVKLNSDTSKNWSVDPTGVVTWDTADQSGTMTWPVANTTCASVGGRLPSFEQLKALYTAYGSTPPGFSATYYWTGTTIPSDSSQAYYVWMSTGVISGGPKTPTIWSVRCVH